MTRTKTIRRKTALLGLLGLTALALLPRPAQAQIDPNLHRWQGFSWNVGAVSTGSQTRTLDPNASTRRITARPIAPDPITPTVAPTRSFGVMLPARSHR